VPPEILTVPFNPSKGARSSACTAENPPNASTIAAATVTHVKIRPILDLLYRLFEISDWLSAPHISVTCRNKNNCRLLSPLVKNV
jgi:hypothetical protein